MPDGVSQTSTLHTPLAVYRSQIGSKLVDDPSQLEAITALNALFLELTNPRKATSDIQKGLYLWGDVGRGKTFLMDLFYDCLPAKGKLRLHFHRFMARIHQALKEHAGQQDPLVQIAKDLAKHNRILCFDEFFVSDIGDAMILAGLFTCLFEQGVVLVATSNIPTERLYENGLARHKFLPCIALLQQHTQTLHLAGKQDHRLHAQNVEINSTVDQFLSNYIGVGSSIDLPTIFSELTQAIPLTQINHSSIDICHRQIPVIQATQRHIQNSVVWFDFAALCEGPRSQLDYIEIASSYNTLMLSGVPQLGGKVRGWIKARGTEDGVGENQATTTGERVVSYAVNDDMARRFISLIDELYDQGVRLYLSTEVPLNELYLEGALTFEFRRTYSRLIEMSRD